MQSQGDVAAVPGLQGARSPVVTQCSVVFSAPQIWNLAFWCVQEAGHPWANPSAFLWDVPGIS